MSKITHLYKINMGKGVLGGDARKKVGFGGFHRGCKGIPTLRRGVQIRNQGVWGPKIHGAHPSLNVGYPRVKGWKIAPSARVEAAESGTCTGTQDVPGGRKNPQ